MSTVLITGGTGMIGKRLTKQLLQKGYEVVIMSRENDTKKETIPGVQYAVWDTRKQTIDANAIAKASYIIHLAGAGVADKRWTEDRKNEIKTSRVDSSRLIVKALTEIPNQVQTVVSASAIGWYGADKQGKGVVAEPFTEDAPADPSFLGETCQLWEKSIEPTASLGKRLVKLRIGIVLSTEGGALLEFMKPVKFGIGAVLGSGKQVVSWIHVDDLCRLFIYAIENELLHGVYNAVAPSPVTNQQLTASLAQRMKGRFYVPMHVPSFILKTMLGEMSVEVLKSTNVSSNKIRFAGFDFNYSTIDEAINDLIAK